MTYGELTVFANFKGTRKYTDSLKPSISELIDDFIGLIYPRYCLACKGALMKGEDILCTTCILELPQTDFHLYPQNPLFLRLFGRIELTHALAFLHFRKGGKVQHLLHELKYQNQPEIGRVMGKVYGEKLSMNGYRDSFDCILPVPLHPTRLRRRGYNQSEEFARGLSQFLNAECIPNALRRNLKTETQTRKTKLKRWQNVSDVFSVADRSAVEGKRILLVDDVITTGATLEACGRSILEAGGTRLSIAGIAYAHE